MTREEIEQLDDTEPYCFETNREELWYNVGLKEGLETADQHPMKGLWDSEKVIDYIYNHAHVRTFGDIVIDDMSVTEFIETMKKAMEE